MELACVSEYTSAAPLVDLAVRFHELDPLVVMSLIYVSIKYSEVPAYLDLLGYSWLVEYKTAKSIHPFSCLCMLAYIDSDLYIDTT